MTTADSDLNRDAPTDEAVVAPAREPVGYGKPPAAHRFKKGKSGNPGGKRKVKPSKSAVPQLPTGSFHEMVLLETDRMVRVKAGGRMVEIPAIQASLRALAMQAAKGNRLAAATLAQLRMRSDAAEHDGGTPPAAASAPFDRAAYMAAVRAGLDDGAEDTALEAAGEYKEIWTKVLTAAADLDVEIAAPVPHPDDVIVGRVRGTVTWPDAQAGETLSLDRLAATHAELQAELPARRAGIEAVPEGYEKAVEWCRWFALDDIRALIATHLPARYTGQIEADARTGAERIRDQSLRIMAEDERRRVELLRERGIVPAAGGDAWGGPGRGYGRASGNPAQPAVVEVAQDPAQAVAEAIVYRDAWNEALEALEEMEVRLPFPDPQPGEVTIETEPPRVIYRLPPQPGERATLDNLRAGLAGLQEEVARYQHEEAYATQPRFAVIARRKREEMLVLCGIIERHLIGAEEA